MSKYQKFHCWYALVRVFVCIVVLVSVVGHWTYAEGQNFIRGKVSVIDWQGNIKNDHSGVVVFLDNFEKPISDPAPSKKASITQIQKKFIPNVLPIQVGTTVDFPNEDKIFHNVFSLSQAKNFDLGLYKKGVSKSVTFDQPGLVKVFCNIHPQMLAHILVLDNSYFTMTDPNGDFMLPSPGAGKVTVRTWYSKAKTHPEEKIVVSEEEVKGVNFEINEIYNLRLRK